ncbi:transposase [Streptomyces sp. ISL-44]|uniref:IS110 family transposase n=1 Tax=Streptomyces sp. ISL-44 TaxID=2819184 RepID=UPI001BE88C8B|nr:transposase [Streptomyces sp. ISL-44]MBT2539823.1 transposase [Streptomyces sp. ISL-44]
MPELSRRVMNDETELPGLLLNHGQPVAYLTGRAVHQAPTTYRGEDETDARDAFIIADQARVRRGVSMFRPGDDTALDLRVLTARRLGVVHDRSRRINRLRAQLLEFFPVLERALDLTKKGPRHLADRLPDPGRDPPHGCQAAGGMAP